MDTCPLNIISLCSGAGGLDLGIRLAAPSARTVCYVEVEAYCCEVLASRMEEKLLDPAPIWTDIKTFDGQPWRGVVDLVTGGYPCQPFSLSGRRKGEKDPRHIWPSVKRVLEETEAPLAFMENVEGHISLGFEEVSDALQGMGYEVEAVLVSAREVGASHRRRRLFILASRGIEPARGLWRLSGFDRLADSNGTGVVRGDKRRYRKEGQALRERQNGARSPIQPGDGGETLVSPGGAPVGLFPPVPGDSGWWDIFQKDPLLKPALRDVADELAPGVAEHWFSCRKDQLRALGNGVVPACAAYALGILLSQMLGEPEV